MSVEASTDADPRIYLDDHVHPIVPREHTVEAQRRSAGTLDAHLALPPKFWKFQIANICTETTDGWTPLAINIF